jgi:hypothetical protein
MSNKPRPLTVWKDRNYHHVNHTVVDKIPRWSSLAAVGNEPGMEGDIIIDRSQQLFCFHDGKVECCPTRHMQVLLRALFLAPHSMQF